MNLFKLILFISIFNLLSKKSENLKLKTKIIQKVKKKYINNIYTEN